jgi:hypothetical protein
MYMRDEFSFDTSARVVRGRGCDSSPSIVLLAAIVTALISAAVCVAAILAPAPAAAAPLVVAISIGCPVFAAWDVPVALASLRADRAVRSGKKALATLRRNLEQLPETEHPLGL